MSLLSVWFFRFFFYYQLTPLALVWICRRDADRFSVLPFFLSVQNFNGWTYYGHKSSWYKGIIWIRWSAGQSPVAREVATSSPLIQMDALRRKCYDEIEGTTGIMRLNLSNIFLWMIKRKDHMWAVKNNSTP